VNYIMYILSQSTSVIHEPSLWSMKNIIFTSVIKFSKQNYIFNDKHLTIISGILWKSIHLLASKQFTVIFRGTFYEQILDIYTKPGRPITLIDNTSMGCYVLSTLENVIHIMNSNGIISIQSSATYNEKLRQISSSTQNTSFYYYSTKDNNY